MQFGLIGEILGHSVSPVIHQKLFHALGISGAYTLIEIPRGQLAHAIPSLQKLDGFNVTIPYKTDIIPHLASLSEEAARIGAVNTVKVDADGLHGYNTDYTGFSCTVDTIGADISGNDVTVLGTGGAARAIIQCLYDRGATAIHIASRHPEMVDEDFRQFAGARSGELVSYEALSGTGGALLVNCTPCGMYPHCDAMPVSADVAASYPKVIDIIYNPKETKLLRAARASEADVANGMYMLVGQAVAAEEIWLGRPISAGITEQIAKEMENAL